MSSVSWSIPIALALLPLAVAANEMPRQAGPADTTASVPAPLYQSVLRSDRPAIDAGEKAPNQLWREANRVVGELAGHGGHLDSSEDGNNSAAADRNAGHGAHGHWHGE